MQPSIYFSKTASELSVRNLDEFNKLPKINPNDFTTIVNGRRVEDFLENGGDLGYPMFYENGDVTIGNKNGGGHTYFYLNEKGDEPDTDHHFFAGKIIPLTDGRIIITDRTGIYNKLNNIDITNIKGAFANLLFTKKVQMKSYSEYNHKRCTIMEGNVRSGGDMNYGCCGKNMPCMMF